MSRSIRSAGFVGAGGAAAGSRTGAVATNTFDPSALKLRVPPLTAQPFFRPAGSGPRTSVAGDETGKFAATPAAASPPSAPPGPAGPIGSLPAGSATGFELRS